MARIRTLKQEFLTDSKTGPLGHAATKLFIGLLIHSDDYGVSRFDLGEMKVRMVPYIQGSAEDVVLPALFDEILSRGLAVLFRVPRTDDQDSPNIRRTLDESSRLYLHVTNFDRHQRVDRPGKPILLGWRRWMTPEEYGADIADISKSYDISRSDLGLFDEYSSNARESSAGERKGREGKGKEVLPSARSDSRSTPPPPPTPPPPEEPSFLTIPLVDGSEHPIYERDIAEWEVTFPAVDVRHHLRRARQWNLDNPRNRKTRAGIRKHLTGWLAREQDRGPSSPRALPAPQPERKGRMTRQLEALGKATANG